MDSQSNIRVSTQFFTAFAASIGAMMSGAIIGFTAPAGPQLLDIFSNSSDTSPDSPWQLTLTPIQYDWMSSIPNLAAALSSVAAGAAINTFGRRMSLRILALPLVIGWLLLGLANGFALMFLGRLLLGFCLGGVTVAAPTLIGEVVSPHVRGLCGAMFQLMSTIGTLYVYIIGAVISWRWLALACIPIPVLLGIGTFIFRESPTFLVAKHREEEAIEALRWFRGPKYDCDKELNSIKSNMQANQDPKRAPKLLPVRRMSVYTSSKEYHPRKMSTINLQFTSMEKDMKLSPDDTQTPSAGNSSALHELKHPWNLRPLGVCMGLMVAQQFCGINAILFNSSTIFEEVDTGMSQDISTILLGVTQVLGTLAGTLLVDRLGRRTLLMASSCVMAVSLAGVGTYFFEAEKDHEYATETLAWLPLASLLLFMVAFSVAWGPIPWLMMGELFSADVRELCSSIASSSYWALSFIITLTFGPMQMSLGPAWTYWLFGICCLVSLVFVLFLVPETKGKTLEEVAVLMGRPQEYTSAPRDGRKSVTNAETYDNQTYQHNE